MALGEERRQLEAENNDGIAQLGWGPSTNDVNILPCRCHTHAVCQYGSRLLVRPLRPPPRCGRHLWMLPSWKVQRASVHAGVAAGGTQVGNEGPESD